MIHLFPNGNVEVGTGKPGYRLVPAYSEVTKRGYSQPLPRREWYAIARRDRSNTKFHDDEAAARKAWNAMPKEGCSRFPTRFA